MLRAKVDNEALATLRKSKIFFTVSGQDRLCLEDVVTFSPDAAAEPYSALLNGHELPSIGSFSYSWSPLPAGIRVARYCSLSSGIRIMAGNHPTEFISTSSFSYDGDFVIFAQALADGAVPEFRRYPAGETRSGRSTLPIIENDVWIGQDVILGLGITLGTGCVIAAGSVVTRSVPPYAIVGGNPARIIRMRFGDDIIQKLLASNWWIHRFSDFAEMHYDKPDIFLDQLEERRDRGEIEAFSVSPLLWREIFKEVI